jgi:hypothetical protein
LKKNLDKIDWHWLSINPGAIHLLEQNQDKIDWICLSSNPGAIHLLEKNLDKIDHWNWLSRNPAIFTYDYEKIKDYIEKSGLKDEIMASYYSPNNISKFLQRGDVESGFETRWSYMESL